MGLIAEYAVGNFEHVKKTWLKCTNIYSMCAQLPMYTASHNVFLARLLSPLCVSSACPTHAPSILQKVTLCHKCIMGKVVVSINQSQNINKTKANLTHVELAGSCKVSHIRQYFLVCCHYVSLPFINSHDLSDV